MTASIDDEDRGLFAGSIHNGNTGNSQNILRRAADAGKTRKSGLKAKVAIFDFNVGRKGARNRVDVRINLNDFAFETLAGKAGKLASAGRPRWTECIFSSVILAAKRTFVGRTELHDYLLAMSVFPGIYQTLENDPIEREHSS